MHYIANSLSGNLAGNLENGAAGSGLISGRSSEPRLKNANFTVKSASGGNLALLATFSNIEEYQNLESVPHSKSANSANPISLSVATRADRE
jgi:hypothetical protein